MRRSIFIFVACVLSKSFLLSANPPLLHDIHFTGNTVFRQDELLGRMTLKQGNRFSLDQLTRDSSAIIGMYQGSGYYFATLVVEWSTLRYDSTRVDLSVKINEGTPVYVDTLELRGNTEYSRYDIIGDFAMKQGQIFNEERLEEDVDMLISKYERNGYPFVRVEIENITVDTGSPGGIRISLKIQEGKRVTIDEIRISGNKQTRSDVIVRESRLRLHELYNEDKVKKIPVLLHAMNLFSKVQEPDVFIDSNGGGLLLNVTEENTNTFDGIVGYSPPATGTGSGVFSGYVHISMGNLFGTARKFDVMWQRDNGSSQEINMMYREPWLFNYPVTLSGVFHQRQQDSTYIQRSVEGHADFFAFESFSFGGFISHTVVIPSSTILFQPLLANRVLSFGLNLQDDTRDDFISPASGIFYRTVYQIGSKKIFGNSPNTATSVQSMTIDAEGYKGTTGNQVIAIGVHGRQILGSQLQITDYFRFGGATTLRGYLENEFIGSRVAWTNLEYRFLLERHSYFFPLFDMGFSYLPGDESRGIAATKLFKYGYGIGLRVDSPLGNIGVSLAFGAGDSFRQGKLHVGLMNRF
jgi:outer membrane protein assembly factor BamA